MIYVRQTALLNLKKEAEKSFLYGFLLNILLENSTGKSKWFNKEIIDDVYMEFDDCIEPVVKRLIEKGVFVNSDVKYRKQEAK